MRASDLAKLIRRNSLFLLAFLYALVFEIVYREYLYPTLGRPYFYNFFPRPVLSQVLCLIIAAVPVLFHRGFGKVSSYIAMLIYVVCYVPTIVTLLFGLQRGLLEVTILQALFMASMCLLFLADRADIVWLPVKTQRQIPILWLHVFTLICTLAVVLAFAGHMKFVSPDNSVAAQRFAARDLHAPFYVGYMMMWLASCLYPIYFVIGLLRKKIVYVIISCCGHVLIYMCAASKLSLLTPLLLAIVYAVLKIGRKRVLAALLLGIIFFTSALLVVAPQENTVVKWTKMQFFMRILGNAAVSNVLYYDFFLSHRYTYYTHIKIIKYLTHKYPYGSLDLGQVIGKEYSQSDDLNINANFWATDGIAAAGIPGLLAISVLVALFFTFVNSVFKEIDLLFAAMIVTPFTMNLANLPFFTSLLSGGGLLLLLIVRYVRLGFKRPAALDRSAGV